MKVSTRSSSRLRLCALAVLSAGLLFAADAAKATATGTVAAWGCQGSDFGQCSVPSGLSGVTGIAAGSRHSLALKGDGTVAAWGCGGKIGSGPCRERGGLSGVAASAEGNNRSLALKGGGTVTAGGCGG